MRKELGKLGNYKIWTAIFEHRCGNLKGKKGEEYGVSCGTVWGSAKYFV
jgi:hypothetical protein